MPWSGIAPSCAVQRLHRSIGAIAARTTEETAVSDDEQAIRELVATWMAASKAGEHATVLSLMTDDVVFMVPGREPFGKEAFAAASKAAGPALIEGTADIVELKVLGDWAWLRDKLKVTIASPGGTPTTRSGYTLTILRKGPDGKWRLVRDANLLA
jgi:uncharacterized protein (TIGR02246 family)